MEKDEKKNSDKPRQASDSKPDRSRKRIKYVLLSLLGVIVIVTATVFVVLFIVGDGDPPLVERIPTERPVLPTGVQGSVVTMDNLDDVRAAIAAPPEDAHYNAVMSVEWTFDRWDTPSRDAYVENSTDNTRTVYFDVFLDGTEEFIYSSPFIPVGGKLDNIALDTEVQAGQYTATVVYYLVDDDFEVITHLSVMIWLNILG